MARSEHEGERSGREGDITRTVQRIKDVSGSEEDGESSEHDRRRKKHRRSRKRRSDSSKRKSHRKYRYPESSSTSSSSGDSWAEDGSSGSDLEESSYSSSEDSEGERRRRRRREKRRKRKEKEKSDEYKKKKKKKKEKEKRKRRKVIEKDKGKRGAVTDSWGKYGTIKEIDMWNKRPEFNAWLAEVKQVNLEILSNWEEKQMFKEYMEDYNTATLSSKKYYDLDAFFRRQAEKDKRKWLKKGVEVERTVFDDEDQRRKEVLGDRERRKEEQIESLKHTMRSGMAQAMKEQAQLREEMAYQYKLGNFEAAAAIQKRLDPDVVM